MPGPVPGTALVPMEEPVPVVPGVVASGTIRDSTGDIMGVAIGVGDDTSGRLRSASSHAVIAPRMAAEARSMRVFMVFYFRAVTPQ